MSSTRATLPAGQAAVNPPPIVPVKLHERRRWQHLLSEAITRGLTITEVGRERVGQTDQIIYTVTSYTSVGLTYMVTVERWGAGATGTRCGCRAGEFASACTHGALAMDTAGMWPTGMVIARQATLPNPDDRYEFWLGDSVRIGGTERTGVVSGIRVAEGRPLYRIDDPEQREPLGMYASYELVPATKPAHTPKVDQSAGLALLMGRRA